MNIWTIVMLAGNLIRLIAVIGCLAWVANSKISRHKRTLAILGLGCIGSAPLLSFAGNLMFSRLFQPNEWGTYSIIASTLVTLLSSAGLILLVSAVVAKDNAPETDGTLKNHAVYTEETGNPYQQPSHS